MIFEKVKAKKKEVDNAVEGVKGTITVVSKITEAKNKAFEWVSNNPEKTVMIFLGVVTTVLVGSELKRNKTEVNVTINMPRDISH